MKKSHFLSLLLIFTLLLVSCKDNKKKELDENTPLEKGFTIEPTTSTINWVAYKTTSKLPVKGQFTNFTIENSTKGATIKEALDGLKFSIPISGLVTNDTIRDGKLKKFFFGSMVTTSEITGTLHLNTENSGSAAITMNGISKMLPITYMIDEQTVRIEAVMDLDNWKAQAALDALNVVCKDLHTGDDGVSKTWNDVKIEVIASLKYE